MSLAQSTAVYSQVLARLLPVPHRLGNARLATVSAMVRVAHVFIGQRYRERLLVYAALHQPVTCDHCVSILIIARGILRGL